MKSNITESYSIIQKVGLSLLGIMVITLLVDYLVKQAIKLRQLREKEGFHVKMPDPIPDFDIPIEDAIINPIKDMFRPIMDAFNHIQDLFKPITDMIDKIDHFFKGFPRLIEGINNHVNCGAEEVKEGVDNSLAIFSIILGCSWDKFSNFINGKCTIYYLVDMIFGIFYGIFIEFPLLIIFAITGFDMQFLVDLVITIAIAPFDLLIHTVSGFHITQWPDSVLSKCYRCKGTIQVDGKSQTSERLFNEWWVMLNCTTQQFISGIRKIFISIIPLRWSMWFNGDHLDGGDNYPDK